MLASLILQRGERVLSRAEAAGYERREAARVEVNIINQAAGTEVRTRKRREGGIDIRDVIITTVNDGMANGRLSSRRPICSRSSTSLRSAPAPAF